jgi:hypothetical protein
VGGIDRQRYLVDPAYRAHVTANNRASYARRQAIKGKLVKSIGPCAPRKNVIPLSGVQHHHRQRYSLEPCEFDRLYEEQEGKCACCFSLFVEPGKLHVDHDHELNKVRGLLCHKCNRGIGLLGDTLESVQRAVSYLLKSQGVGVKE